MIATLSDLRERACRLRDVRLGVGHNPWAGIRRSMTVEVGKQPAAKPQRTFFDETFKFSLHGEGPTYPEPLTISVDGADFMRERRDP
jgi:hypothetical protein